MTRSMVLPMQLRKNIGLKLPGSFGLGMGIISAFFLVLGRRPAPSEALKSNSRAACPDEPAWRIMVWEIPSEPGDVSALVLSAAGISCAFRGASVGFVW